MPKRNDAVPVTDLKLFNRIFPYLMKRRCDSLVYYKFDIEMTNAVHFIQKKNREADERKYRIFDLIMAAMTRTIALRPGLNRFISDYEYWQRNEISFNFIVKKDLHEDSPEHKTIVKFEEDMNFEEVAAIMRQAINSAMRDEEYDDESLIRFLLRLPKWLLKIAVLIMKRWDRKGRLPKRIRDVDGLHVSAFIANLGSINIPNPPYHHLYEWGTTSFFVTLGKLHRIKILDENDNEYIKDTIQLGITIDERIAEGFYFMKAMRILREHLENPELLEERPDPSMLK
ncbi:MAG: 2-oxoacid:acceptor oxidoreductase [Spirochaetales bacterium]|nr:2-oxoacid:acceptor oxidoreductase [Spirochaetales bacterium]